VSYLGAILYAPGGVAKGSYCMAKAVICGSEDHGGGNDLVRAVIQDEMLNAFPSGSASAPLIGSTRESLLPLSHQ
jgi:hypothetical protein